SLLLRNCSSTWALLWVSSRALYNKVTRLCFRIAAISSSIASDSSSSSSYFLRNSTHLDGRWLNHFRSSVEGDTPFDQRSIPAVSFFTPRGHSRSINARKPSASCGCSYTLLICKDG